MRWREPCIVCKQPVFIAQRLRVEGRLYHRTCFRCARCGAQLSAADYYETCSGDYVCETCPDEMPVPEKTVTVVPLQEPMETPPPLPVVPPPSAPPEPPPSLVAMRRLMFDTDDAKLGKHDHIVNNTRIINSIKKDLSKNDDTRSRVDLIDSDNNKIVNSSLDKSGGGSEENLEADSNATNSEALVQNVNNSTIPACSDDTVPQRMDDPGQTSPETSEKKDSTKLIPSPEEDQPLDISGNAPSFNDNLNTSNIENTSYSDSDSNQANTTISFIVTEDEPSDVVDVVEAINTDVTSSEAVNEVANIENDDKQIIDEKPSEEYPDDLNPFDDSGDEEKTEQKTSTNPFGSDSEEEEVTNVMLKPRPRTSTINTTPQVSRPASTNPFDSDDDEEEVKPVPLPRKSFQSSPEPTPFPRRSRLRSSGRSITSLTSIASSTSPRKKRPAPPPPTPGTLTPSSRYSSISSLASNRPRKNRRAPLPPSLPKAVNEPVQPLDKSEELAVVPQIEISIATESVQHSLETTGDIANQIEEGMKKLMDEHDKIGDDHVQVDVKEKEDSIDDSSNLATTIDEIKVPNKNDESEQYSTNEENKQIPDLEVSAIIGDVSKDPNVDLNSQNCDKFVEKIVKEENNDASSLVEAYNNEFKSMSRNSSIINSSMIKFDEMEPIKHSTPVKVDVSRTKDGSLEEMPSAHSYSGSFYPSPPGSIADSSSYQESTPTLEKKHKDSSNMHRKISESGIYYPPKSSYGQWKRKKPAPPAPLPQRRIVKPMAIHRIKQELGDIEIKQQELERQGVALEQKIREKFDSDVSITPYLEELVLQLFELVNEKNELFRKQAELMYLRRQHQLEEEHAELEFQIRCLMARPELNKTDTDKELEEKLIQRLIEVVERRDAIVQCLEMDRLREAEEDKSIHKQLDRFSQVAITDERMKVTKKHKKKKDKHNSLKMLDMDKDFDESEKESKKKKKWYTLHPKMGKHL